MTDSSIWRSSDFWFWRRLSRSPPSCSGVRRLRFRPKGRTRMRPRLGWYLRWRGPPTASPTGQLRQRACECSCARKFCRARPWSGFHSCALCSGGACSLGGRSDTARVDPAGRVGPRRRSGIVVCRLVRRQRSRGGTSGIQLHGSATIRLACPGRATVRETPAQFGRVRETRCHGRSAVDRGGSDAARAASFCCSGRCRSGPCKTDRSGVAARRRRSASRRSPNAEGFESQSDGTLGRGRPYRSAADGFPWYSGRP